jgi:diguanylate cyclase (GGDEF)-like protein/PAS domain S-box-containing protein
MARSVKPLSESRIRRAKAGEKPLKLADGGGMYLLLNPDGSRYWRLDYRFEGRRKTLALGVYPEVALEAARKRREEARSQLAAGLDPVAVRRARKAEFQAPRGGSELQLAQALAIIGEGVWDWDLRSGTVRHNAQWGRLMGLDGERGQHVWQQAMARLHPQDREQVMAAIQVCLDGEAAFEHEHRVVHADGTTIWVRNRGEVLERDGDGNPLRMVGSLLEVTGQKRTELVMRRRNLLLQMIAAVNEMLMAGLPEHELMSRICRELVRDNLFRMAWIGLVEADGVTVRPVAEAGFVRGYLDATEIRCDDTPLGRGPTGCAIRTGTTQVNDDTETSVAFAPWREQARTHGYRSSAAAPLRVRGRVVGALNVYGAEAHAFGPEKVMLLEKLASDLGMAMAHREVLDTLRESEERFRLLLDSSPEAIFGVDTQGVCTFVNPACLRMLGYERHELLGHSVHPLIHHTYPDGRPYPKEQCHIRCSTLQGKATHVDSEVHWRKDGSSFPVEYWSHPMYRDGELVGAVVTFVDISERKRMEQSLRLSEERYRLISNVATDLLYSCLREADGAYVIDWATASADRVFGYTPDEILARGCWRCYVHPDDRPEFDRCITGLEAGQRSECELRVISRDGTTRHIRAYSMVEDANDGAHRYRLYGACQDITDRKRAEDALRKSEARFRTMAEQSADWIWAIDALGNHTYSNQRGVASLGYTVAEFLAADATALVHPDDLPLFRATLDTALAARQGWQSVVLRWRHRDGSYRTFESNASPLFDESGQLTGFQGVDRDVTERRQAEERIAFLAHHDGLTGLPNRILLRDRFAQALATAERSRSRVAMLFLDLDNFKMVNDTLGHAAGDQLLLAVVERLAACTRDSDTISRQGGDEFILLLNDIPDLETVERIAGEILGQLAEPVEVSGHVLNASSSIGIAIYPDDGGDFDSLLQKADTAMYSAKDAGRNTIRFFDERMNLQAHDYLLLQNRLHQALFRAEFQLHYQPQLEAGSGRVIGVEALLRWHNPELGEVAPARFIPVAEDCGLIVPIGAWVMEEACRQVQAWRRAGWPELTISVNLSALQFRRAGLIETVAGILERSGLPPQLLELELTESILLQNVENNLDMIRRLKALGVRLSIDDFGTGYSSLSYLKRFAVDRLKIDQSFVRDISTDPDDAAIVRAIIQLARNLRLGIIAEGVETPEQLAFLRAEGCPEVQGYLFSRPLAAAELRAYLLERQAAAGRALDLAP